MYNGAPVHHSHYQGQRWCCGPGTGAHVAGGKRYQKNALTHSYQKAVRAGLGRIQKLQNYHYSGAHHSHRHRQRCSVMWRRFCVPKPCWVLGDEKPFFGSDAFLRRRTPTQASKACRNHLKADVCALPGTVCCSARSLSAFCARRRCLRSPCLPPWPQRPPAARCWRNVGEMGSYVTVQMIDQAMAMHHSRHHTSSNGSTEKLLPVARHVCHQTCCKKPRPLASAMTCKWYTPQPLLDGVRAAFGGHIDLDPCSDETAQASVKARRFFSIEQDGWTGPG